MGQCKGAEIPRDTGSLFQNFFGCIVLSAAAPCVGVHHVEFRLQVGTYLKTPRFPVWVVCSESHFSVLFALRRELLSDWKAERRFDLFYWDGLARQDEQIRLTVGQSPRRSPRRGFFLSLLCK